MSTADSPTKPTAARPQLPYSHMNPFLSPANTLKSPVVKYQVITREGQEITVGRVKIPTPGNGHAFILRRFDTGAISQTTMFRAAFPTSPEELEKVESAWVKQSFDCSTANGGSGKSSLRLAGTWVHPETASELAPLYYLEPIVTSLLSARPDPNQEYRRSTKAGSNNNNNNSNAPPTSASTENGASSPVKASGRAPLSPRASPKPTKRRREEREATPDSQSSTGLGLPTRRVVRGSSPALPVVPGSGSGSPNTQRISRTKMTKTVVNRSSPVKGESSPKKAVVTAAATAATTTRSVIVEKVREEEDEEVVDVPGPNMHEDIAEQKELIAKLKAERDANAAAALAAAAAASKTEAEDSKEGKEEEEEEAQVPEPEPQSSKRAREDEQEGGQQEVLQFKFREPEEQEVIAAREIRSNKRLSLDLEPQQKSAAWGALWFVSGLAAAVTIPSFFL